MKSTLVTLLALLFALGSAAGAENAPAKKPAQFLGILRLAEKFHAESSWDDAAKAAVGRHFTRLKEHATTGKVILAGRTRESNDRTMGLVIFEAADLKEAERFMAEDPAVEAGVMIAEVRPYQVALQRP